MSLSERNQDAVEETFSLIVDQYGRLWLHVKIEGVPLEIDLAEKNMAFEIMAATMAENDFGYHPVQGHEPGDNDDELGAL